MKSKKTVQILLATFIILLLSGCSDKNSGVEEPTTIRSIASFEELNASDMKEEYPLETDREKFQPPKESQEFNFGTDCQYYMTSHYSNAESEKCIYFIDDTTCEAYVFDKATKNINKLCGKAECSHADFDYQCNAFMSNASGMFYYKESIYVLMLESRGIEEKTGNYLKDLNIYKISEDGFDREKVATIYTAVSACVNPFLDMRISCIQHRGYLYYVYDLGSYDDSSYYYYGSHCIHRVNLETFKEDEKCVAYLPVGGDYFSAGLTAKGSYVYYLKPDKEGFGEVYRFNTENLVNEKMNMGTIAVEDMALMNDVIMYKKDWQSSDIYKYNPLTGEDTLFINMEFSRYKNCYDIYTNETYIYVNCKDKMNDNTNFEIIDRAGKHLGTVCKEYQGTTIFSRDGSQLAIYLLDGEDGQEMVCYYLDANNIEAGNPEYEIIR